MPGLRSLCRQHFVHRNVDRCAEHAARRGVSVLMTEQFRLVEAIAREAIVQCRREIELAWAQVEAAKEVLRRGRWLLARWAAQAQTAGDNRPSPSRRRSEAATRGMFVAVD